MRQTYSFRALFEDCLKSPNPDVSNLLAIFMIVDAVPKHIGLMIGHFIGKTSIFEVPGITRLWRRGWDSNPRTGSPGKTLSRRLPYGHSGTPPQGFDYSRWEEANDRGFIATSACQMRLKLHLGSSNRI